MDDDVLIVVVLLLGVGVAAWLILGRKGAEMPPPPCNVNLTYSGVGVGVPCNAIKEIPKIISDGATAVLKPLSGAVATTLGLGSTGVVDCSTWGGRGEKIVTSRGGTCGEAGTKVSTATGSATALSREQTSILGSAFRKV